MVRRKSNTAHNIRSGIRTDENRDAAMSHGRVVKNDFIQNDFEIPENVMPSTFTGAASNTAPDVNTMF